MRDFVCPHCPGRSDIFRHGGARAEAAKLGVDFLGEIPLDMEIRETSDSGRPIVVSKPDSPHAQSYRTIARSVWDKVQHAQGASGRKAPRIVIQ